MNEFLAYWCLVSLIAMMLLGAVVMDRNLDFDDVVTMNNYTTLGRLFYILYIFIALPLLLLFGCIGILLWSSEKFIKRFLLK